MENIFQRTEMLLGKEAVSKLKNSSVVLFGLGGVGSYTFEALVRSGVGKITVIDSDSVELSNLNRQLIATTETVGIPKVTAAYNRGMLINPHAEILPIQLFFTPENSHTIDFSKFDYIIDAIDCVTSKIELVLRAYESHVPIVSCLGTGNKLDPTRLQITDIYKTSVCPLARVMRYELRKRNIPHLKVLFSDEQPIKPLSDSTERTPGSVSFVPGAAGLIIAGEVIKDLIS